MAQLREAEIRARLRQSREEAGLSRERFAEILVVHPKSIENYEKERVPWSYLNVWASATGKSLEWLLHGDGAAPPSSDPARVEELLIEIRDQLAAQHQLLSQLVAAILPPPDEDAEATLQRRAQNAERGGGTDPAARQEAE